MASFLSRSLRLLAGTSWAVIALAAPVTYFDTSFNTADWTPTVAGTNGATVQILGPIIAAGNPSVGQAVVIVFPRSASGSNSTATGVSLNNVFQYDPATQGAVTSLSIGFDVRFSGSSGLSTPAAPFYRPVLRQNGLFYSFQGSSLQPPNSGAWTPASFTSLSAADWTRSGGGNPDFSLTGGILQFGYSASISFSCGTSPTGFCATASLGGHLDNFSIAIDSVSGGGGTSDVPEPSTLALLAPAAGATLLVRRTRRRQGQRQ
ncbi:MAG: PEP-CTERM sorting domain-containing protein [Bryobacterales bacterium]|nr:PEP-CTERM sorting domain-containing protein [Bryobacterales bacterium]